ncbi:hypothetical protein D3C73_1492390 [compost metagenome]
MAGVSPAKVYEGAMEPSLVPHQVALQADMPPQNGLKCDSVGQRGAEDQELVVLIPLTRAGAGLHAHTFRPGPEVFHRTVFAKNPLHGFVATAAEEPSRLLEVLRVEDFVVLT